MTFEKFEGPWNEIELLGCRNLFCGERLILDLFEYLQSGPDEDLRIGSEAISGTHTIGLTASSRIWRLIFERPFAVRARDQNLKSKQQTINDFPGPCCFSERSEWIEEFIFNQRPGFFTPTHYVFNLIDNFIEIMGDGSPRLEEIAN
ncbi:MAG: hypothetical protein WBX14_10935 [Candidatus Udaeobacter sp.]